MTKIAPRCFYSASSIAPLWTSDYGDVGKGVRREINARDHAKYCRDGGSGLCGLRISRCHARSSPLLEDCSNVTEEEIGWSMDLR